MSNIVACGWHTLTRLSLFQHRTDEGGRLLIRGGVDSPPFDVSAEKAVPCEWHKADKAGGWELRTKGNPSTATRIRNAFGDLAQQVAGETGVDARILLTQVACEAAPSRFHPSGKSLQSPRTEVGYPGRQGENDFGDEARDVLDWAKSKGMHSSHGVCQLLIGTAVSCRPDLFAGVPVEKFREVLWSPEASFRCLSALALKLPAAAQYDPLAIRVCFGAGGVYEAAGRWGVRLYNESILLHWLAYWGDLAAVLSEPPLAA